MGEDSDDLSEEVSDDVHITSVGAGVPVKQT